MSLYLVEPRSDPYSLDGPLLFREWVARQRR